MPSLGSKPLLLAIVVLQIAGFLGLWHYDNELSKAVNKSGNLQDDQFEVVLKTIDDLQANLPTSAAYSEKTVTPSVDYTKLQEMITAVFQQEIRPIQQAFRSYVDQHISAVLEQHTLQDKTLDSNELQKQADESEDHPEILANAHAIIDKALIAGTWTKDDARELRKIGGSNLNRSERIELRKRIGQAINSQQLRIKDRSALLF